MSIQATVRAAGMVVYRKASPTAPFEFLLLQASYPPYHWTPPKGHVDPGEDEWTAAIRETEEEAHITKNQLTVHEDCHKTLYYEVNQKMKSVKYWLAKLNDPFDVTLSQEHQNWKWAPLEEAIKTSVYEEMGTLLRDFYDYLIKKS